MRRRRLGRALLAATAVTAVLGQGLVAGATPAEAAAAPVRIASISSSLDASGRSKVKLACAKHAKKRTCKGSVVATVGGAKSAKARFSIRSGSSKTVAVRLTSQQLVELEAAKGERVGATVRLSLTAPVRLSLSSSKGSLWKTPDTPGEGGSDAGGSAGADGHGSADGHGHSDGGTGDPDGSEPVASHALTRSWKPTEYDTCTVAEHDSYAVIGPDGKLYPGWHPPVHERVDGSTCTFGHEHGDDPRGSNIYAWGMEQYAAEARGNGRAITTVSAARGEYLDVRTGRELGLPFGYGSERLVQYADATGSTVHRHEDDPGHKVVVSNGQQMSRDNAAITFTDWRGSAQRLTCDFLFKAHQGSHSSDATKNNTHELIYAAVCNDGTKVFATTMTNYGDSNELHTSCTRPFSPGHQPATAKATAGSNLPAGDGGKRLIPTLDCLQKHTTAGTGVYGSSDSGTGTTDDRRGSPDASTNGWWWAGYEQWQSFTRITDAETGRELVRYEPWFGVQNPSRYYVRNNDAGTDTEVAYLNDLAWQSGPHQNWEPWKSQRAKHPTQVDRRSPDAWFNGAIRDAWIAAPRIDNGGGGNVRYIDPWGRKAHAEPFTGSLRMYLSSSSNTAHVSTTTPNEFSRHTRQGEALKRSGATGKDSLGFFVDYGTDPQGRSLGVHAPN